MCVSEYMCECVSVCMCICVDGGREGEIAGEGGIGRQIDYQ